jgi:hypothetical protein
MGGLGNKQVMAKNIQKRMDERGIDRNELCRVMSVPYSMDGMFIAIIPRLTMI